MFTSERAAQILEASRRKQEAQKETTVQATSQNQSMTSEAFGLAKSLAWELTELLPDNIKKYVQNPIVVGAASIGSVISVYGLHKFKRWLGQIPAKTIPALPIAVTFMSLMPAIEQAILVGALTATSAIWVSAGTLLVALMATGGAYYAAKAAGFDETTACLIAAAVGVTVVLIVRVVLNSVTRRHEMLKLERLERIKTVAAAPAPVPTPKPQEIPQTNDYTRTALLLALAIIGVFAFERIFERPRRKRRS